MFKKIFKKRTAEITIPPDGKIYGNNSELARSINDNVSRIAAEALGFDPNKLSEEELDDFSELGWALYWICRGFHVSKEELEQYEKGTLF